MMGWLSSAGSMARIVGPVIAAGAMKYNETGQLVFILMMGLMGVATAITCFSYRVLRPRSQQEADLTTAKISKANSKV